jgi:phospholipid transport system substrate-binding protein
MIMGNLFLSRHTMANGTVKALTGYVLLLALWPVFALAGDEQPAEVIRSATRNVLSSLAAAPEIRKDPAKLNRIIQGYIVPYVDFVALSRLTLGRNWQQATAQQRSQFAREFGTLLIKTYSTALAEYANQEIEFLSSSVSADKRRATVRTRIIEQGRAPLAVDYSLMQVERTWKIYDVAIEGVSLAINYRTTFAVEIRNHGIDGLIQRLAERNARSLGNLAAAQTAIARPE